MTGDRNNIPAALKRAIAHGTEPNVVRHATETDVVENSRRVTRMLSLLQRHQKDPSSVSAEEVTQVNHSVIPALKWGIVISPATSPELRVVHLTEDQEIPLGEQTILVGSDPSVIIGGTHLWPLEDGRIYLQEFGPGGNTGFVMPGMTRKNVDRRLERSIGFVPIEMFTEMDCQMVDLHRPLQSLDHAVEIASSSGII